MDVDTVAATIGRNLRDLRQVRGVQRMLDEQRPCEDVITQLLAARSALDETIRLIVTERVSECDRLLARQEQLQQRRLALLRERLGNARFDQQVRRVDDVRVRQAMRLLVDRQAMIDNVFLGFGQIGRERNGRLKRGRRLDVVERELLVDRFVVRYRTKPETDGLPQGEAAFLACTFWLADNYALLGRRQDAVDLFESLLTLRNDVGLLAEEYDPGAKRLLGNFPQAFSHIALVNTAFNLTGTSGPATHRRKG